ncbi:MAG TPA: hypothetical protein VI729_11365 [Anaerolineales bacterium]|nr:hypothetical protein [Anaerolineales bacterium]
MRKIFLRVVKILRDPAVQTVIAILAFLILIWGAIAGWFSKVIAALTSAFPWLTEMRPRPNWLVAAFSIALLLLLVAWLRSGPLRRKLPPNRGESLMTYRKVWGVLWGWPPPGGHYVADGPLCPEHRLPLDVKKVEMLRAGKRYDFHCPGREGEEGHVIPGPKFSQLVPNDGWGTRDPSIYKDVNARLRAQHMTTMKE